MNSNELRKMYDDLYMVANELRGKILDEYINAALDLLDHSEMGIGVENILSEIEENEIILPKKSYDILMCAVKYFEIDEIYYKDLKYEKE